MKVWCCLVSAACRSAPTIMPCQGNITSNLINHLKNVHNLVGLNALRAAAAAAAAAAARERRNEDMKAAIKAGKLERYHVLSFIRTWTIGQFSPFVLGEKADVRNFLLDNSAYHACVCVCWVGSSVGFVFG